MRPYLVLSVISLLHVPTFLLEELLLMGGLTGGGIFMAMVGVVMSTVFCWIDRRKARAERLNAQEHGTSQVK
jgi:hypothetical protein